MPSSKVDDTIACFKEKKQATMPINPITIETKWVSMTGKSHNHNQHRHQEEESKVNNSHMTQQDNKREATSSLYPSGMIAKLERTQNIA